MSTLSDLLYRTNVSCVDACKELGIVYNEEDLEDLEQCNSCSVWYYSYQLIPDRDYNSICKFCE